MSTSAEVECRIFARACSIAILVDVLVPRPGLTSVASPRQQPSLKSFIVAASEAYDMCLRSCLQAYRGSRRPFTRCWVTALRRIAAYGNPAMGSLLLLALQASALGRALRRGLLEVEHVMGESESAIEEAGVEGAKDFYVALQMVAPSYLERISWSGLPDASMGRLALSEIEERRLKLRDLLCLASLYDQVSADACRRLELSLGYVYSWIRGSELLSEAFSEALSRSHLCLVAWRGDFLLSRKGFQAWELFSRACLGDAESVRALWRLLGGPHAIGPGSTADVVVNAVARLAYEELRRTLRLPFSSARPTL